MTRTVAFGHGKVKAVILVLTNASARYDCFARAPVRLRGQPRDDNLEFDYRASARAVVLGRRPTRVTIALGWPRSGMGPVAQPVFKTGEAA